MPIRTINSFSLAALLLLAVPPACVSAADRGGAPLAEGTWGGPHIQMTVESQGATVELDCAHGVISKPILVGKDGRFRVSGTYFPEHGGPVRESDEKGRPAVYTGRLEDETLSLGIAYEGGEDVLYRASRFLVATQTSLLKSKVLQGVGTFCAAMEASPGRWKLP